MDCLSEPIDSVEIIVVTGDQVEDSVGSAPQFKVISSSGTNRGALLNTGAAVASGDVLLFLWPDSQLRPETLLAIERNFQLLPQTVGGNFHVNFDDDSLYTKLLTRFLKRWRYQGRYYGNSGIFVRKVVFEDLDGFQPFKILEDYDLARRLENYGPTLYLPDTILASARKYKNAKIKAALIWPVMQALFMLGMYPNRLAQLWNKD